jgi:molybdenum ABC transporter molybdate-binding protein
MLPRPETLRPRRRVGSANPALVFLAGAAAVAGMLIAVMVRGRPASPAGHTLTLFAAAGLRAPVDRILAEYEREYGVHVDVQYGGSNTLLNQLQIDEYGHVDLFLAADQDYTDQAVDLGLARETLPVGHQHPLLAVPAANPKSIGGFADLLRKDVSVAMCNPEQAAAGRAVRALLESRRDASGGNLWEALEAAVRSRGVFKPTVSEVANDVAIGAADVGILWDTTVAGPGYRNKLTGMEIPELAGEAELISLAVLESSPNPTLALRLGRYVTARDRGLPTFAAFGVRTVEGDAWVEQPTLNFFCGAVNRRAIEDIVQAFQQREGVIVNTVYDGCGILTGRMKAIEAQRPDLGFPDVYMACDVYYLENVREWFQEAANISEVEIVIAVPKGSQLVRQLDDLVKPGVRVAVGEPQYCTIGALTRRLLESEGLYERLKQKQADHAEVVVEKSSSSLLVPDVVTGHVDAAVAYITDVLANQDAVDIVRIESPYNRAVQPFSVARSSDNKYLVRRLFQAIASSREEFEEVGFRFRLDDETLAGGGTGGSVVP